MSNTTAFSIITYYLLSLLFCVQVQGQPFVGSYTIGGDSADFASLSEAVDSLKLHGIAGEVVLNYNDGEYTEQLTIPYIEGTSSENKIIIQSASRDSSKVRINEVVTNSSQNAVIILDSAQHLHFRHLSIYSAGRYGSIIRLLDSCRHNTFSDNLLVSVTSQHFYLATASQATTIHNNELRGGTSAITTQYCYDRFDSRNNVITNNKFINQTEKTLSVSCQYNLTIRNNTFEGSPQRGIEVEYTNVLQMTGNQGYPNISFYTNRLFGTLDTVTLIANNYFAGCMEISDGQRIDILHNTFKGAVKLNNLKPVRFLNNIVVTPERSGNPLNFRLHNSAEYEIDYNCYYAQNSTEHLVDTIRNHTGEDAHSISVDPFFRQDSSYLIASNRLDNTGLALAEITTDLEGEIRDMLTPDIGADEFVGSAFDAGVVNIIPPTKPFALGEHPLRVVIKNYGSATLNSVDVYYQVNEETPQIYQWTGELNTEETTEIEVVTIDFEFKERYDFKVWTAQPNGNVEDYFPNDTLSIGGIYAGLGGEYTVGSANADFENLVETTQYLEWGGILDDVKFNIAPGVYESKLTFKRYLNGEGKKLQYYGVTTDSSDVIIRHESTTPYNDNVIRAERAHWLELKYLTLENTSSTYANGLNVNYTDNLILSNCLLRASNYSNGNCDSYLMSGFFARDSTLIKNNCFIGGGYGMSLSGAPSQSAHSQTIANNKLIDQSCTAMRLSYIDEFTVRDNQILGQFSTGINIDHSDNFVLERNQLVVNREDGVVGIATDLYSQNYSIVNNLLYLTSTAEAIGLRLISPRNVELLHNTIVVNSNGDNSSVAYLSSYNVFTNIQNNLFTNINQGSIYHFDVALAAITTESDNNYWTANNALIRFKTERYNLAEWQAINQNDLANYNHNPYFRTDGSSIPTNAFLNAAATYTEQAALDLYHRQRSTERVDIGAVEFDLAAHDSGISAVIFDSQPVPAGDYPLQVRLQNHGTEELTDVYILWQIDGGILDSVQWSGNLPANSTEEVVLPVSISLSDRHYTSVVVYTKLPNGQTDVFSANDTTIIRDLRAALAGTYSIGNDTSTDFNSITAATSVIQAVGMADTVTFAIQEGLYEEQLHLNKISGLNADRPLFIQSADLDSSKVIIQHAGETVALNNVQYITFQYLTVKNPRRQGDNIAIRNAKSITINNNYLENEAGSGSGGESAIVLENVDTINIINNELNYGGYSINTEHFTENSSNSNIRIVSNLLRNARRSFISLGTTNNVYIADNVIRSELTFSDAFGLTLSSTSDTVLIERNQLFMVDGPFFEINSFSRTLINATVRNNYFFRQKRLFYDSFRLSDIDSLDFIHNTVRIVEGSEPLFKTCPSCGYVRLVNNIFAIDEAGYIFSYHTNNRYSDYNCYYLTDGKISYREDTLVEYQEAHETDAHSIFVDPAFTTAEGFKVGNATLAGIALPFAGITDDIDSQSRLNNLPDLGADEFSFDDQPLAIQPLNFSVSCQDDYTLLQLPDFAAFSADLVALEGSKNGINWILIATLDLAKETANIHTNAPYLRLRVTTPNKTSFYSTIKTNHCTASKYRVYPTPATDYLYLTTQLPTDPTKNTQISLYTTAGRLVWNKIIASEQLLDYPIPVHNFESGYYFLVIKNVDKIEQIKVAIVSN